MQGIRVYDRLPANPGEYGCHDGHWWAKPPGTGMPTGMLCDHEVIEHDDGTVTVSPSILLEGHRGTIYHGYLRRGEWETA